MRLVQGRKLIIELVVQQRQLVGRRDVERGSKRGCLRWCRFWTRVEASDGQRARCIAQRDRLARQQVALRKPGATVSSSREIQVRLALGFVTV